VPSARAVVAVLAAAAGLASCGGQEVSTPSASVTASSPVSPSPSPPPPTSPSPPTSVEPSIRSIQLTKDAPTTFADDVSIDALPPEALVPPGAVVTASHVLEGAESAPPALALVWLRGDDPFAAEHGLVVWEWFDEAPAWRVVYAFTDPPSRGVLGIRIEPGDATRDGVDDVLSLEDLGGSGACGLWRVVATGAGVAEEIWRLRGCDTQVRFSRGGLEVREAVFRPGDAHCCPSAYRISRLSWDGATLATVRSTVSPIADAG
jgi:hypothetical protein